MRSVVRVYLGPYIIWAKVKIETTKQRGISSVGRASVLHAEGHRFEPGILQVNSIKRNLKIKAFVFFDYLVIIVVLDLPGIR